MTAKRGDLYIFTVDPLNPIVLGALDSETRGLATLPTGEYLAILSGQLAWNASGDLSDPPYSINYQLDLDLLVGSTSVLHEVVSGQQYFTGNLNYRRGFMQQAGVVITAGSTVSLRASTEGGPPSIPEITLTDLTVSLTAVDLKS